MSCIGLPRMCVVCWLTMWYECVDSIMDWSTCVAVLVKVTNKAKIEVMLQGLEIGVSSKIRGTCTNGATVDRKRVMELVRMPAFELLLFSVPPAC